MTVTHSPSVAPAGADIAAASMDDQSLDRAKAGVRAIVKRSGSSFYWGMRLLPPAKREAMFAVYAFCREVDDVADGPGPANEKLAALEAWRDDIDALFAGQPRNATTLALQEPIDRFKLDKGEFHLMIEGMAMDAAETMRSPSLSELERYCRAVAGTVGILSMSIFEQRSRELDRAALALGEALQLTNILRDIHEDARRGRLYLPRELLTQYGINTDDLAQLTKAPNLRGVCRALAARAEKCFALAERLFDEKGDPKKLRPALVMMDVYHRLLMRMIKKDWQRFDRRFRLSKFERLWIGMRHSWS